MIRLSTIMCVAVLVTTLVVEAEAPPVGITTRVKIIEVYDGDTVVVEGVWRARVRLIDCWAPEVRGEEKERGLESKTALAEMCQGKVGVLHVPGTLDIGKMTNLSRVLGHIWIDDNKLSLSDQMVERGLATRSKNK